MKAAFQPSAEKSDNPSPSEQHATDRQLRRQKALHETLVQAASRSAGDGPPPTRTFTEGLIVVIATYNDNRPELDPGARINTIHWLLLALEHQRAALPAPARDNFKIVIADNGLTDAQLSRLKDYFAALASQAQRNGRTRPQCLVVPAPRIHGDDFTRTAGHARNCALAEIRRRRRRGDRSFDAPVLIHDDDAVTSGIADMYRLLSRNRNVLGAVAPGVVGVRDIARHAARIRSQESVQRRGSAAQSCSFPPVFDRDGLINFSVLFAFGGSRIPKTCALLLHPRAIDSLTATTGEVFHVWKKGSFEDMCCSICLACNDWDITECRTAKAYDQVRSHPEARLRQQFAWGYDHATAFFDFSEISRRLPAPVIHRGVSVLQPLPAEERTPLDGWGLHRLRSLRGFPGLQATLVRPEELRETLELILDSLSTPRRAAFFQRRHAYAFPGALESVENLRAAARTVLRVVRQAIRQAPSVRPIRPEIPFVDHRSLRRRLQDPARQAELLRYTRDARIARLLGNLASLHRNPANNLPEGKARYIALGPRQATP